jgi:hypothetical protein
VLDENDGDAVAALRISERLTEPAAQTFLATAGPVAE